MGKPMGKTCPTSALTSFSGVSDIDTTGRTGANGYAGGDYDSHFSGTSAFIPLAAGIAALVLSKNTTRTSAEIRTILRKSCDKIDGVTWISKPARSAWTCTSRQNVKYGNRLLRRFRNSAASFGSRTRNSCTPGC